MTEEELRAIEMRAKAATPGPWRQGDEGESNEGDADCVYVRDDDSGRMVWRMAGPFVREEDARFVAEAREDVSALVARVRALEVSLTAALRTADRLRHGQDIEGDAICPNEMRAERAEAERDAARREADSRRHSEHAMQARCGAAEKLAAAERAYRKAREKWCYGVDRGRLIVAGHAEVIEAERALIEAGGEP